MLGEAQSQPASLPWTRRQTPRLLSQAISFAAARGLNRALVPIGYLGLVLFLWLPFGPRNGMGYETKFPYDSENTSFWHGFFYSDPLRPYTSVFYNLGYHLSGWLGIPGSYLGIQLVYAALWWARGFLAYLILKALFPKSRVLAALVGVIVLVHAADRATNWVGQLNQFGMIFWTISSIYLLVRAFQASTTLATFLFTVGSMWTVRMGLWSYESPLFIILAVPLMLLVFRFRFGLRSLVIAGAYYASPLSYIWDSYQRYSANGASTYQASVLRPNMSVGPILSDLWFNITNSLAFWNWGWLTPPITRHAEQHAFAAAGAVLAAIIVTAVVIEGRRRALLPDVRSLLWLFGCGCIILVASFPAYVILTSARQLWRTQFLSGIGAALVLASVVALVATQLRTTWAAGLVAVAGAGAIAYYGVSASFAEASFQYGVWSKDKHTMQEVLAVAPRVTPGTLIILTGVPKSDDSFGDNMWFDFAVRLAYPREAVSGIYFYDDGAPSTDENLALHGRLWLFTNTGYPTLLRRVPMRNAVIIRYSPTGASALLSRVPAFIHASPEVSATYAPSARILPGPPSPYAVRRYGPIPGAAQA